MASILLKIILAGTIFTIMVPVNSAIVDNGSTTLDSDTGLHWLDLTASIGYTYAEMELELQTGGIFSSYRRASFEEITLFFGNAGIDGIVNGVSSTNYEPIVNLALLMGADEVFENYIGIFADNDFSIGNFVSLGAFAFSVDHVSQTGVIGVGSNGNSRSNGHFLVETAVVPLPATSWLFLSCLTGISFLKKRYAF